MFCFCQTGCTSTCIARLEEIKKQAETISWQTKSPKMFDRFLIYLYEIQLLIRHCRQCQLTQFDHLDLPENDAVGAQMSTYILLLQRTSVGNAALGYGPGAICIHTA